MPEISREEYSPYRETILQYHLYELIFNESSCSLKIPSENIFSKHLLSIENNADALIKEFSDTDAASAFFNLRWYASHKIKLMFSKSHCHKYSITENIERTQCKSDPCEYDLKMMEAVTEIKAQFNPSLLRLLFSILETFRYYCKVTKNRIKQCYSQEEMLNEYCKRVGYLVTE